MMAPLQHCETTWKHFRSIDISIYLKFDYILLTGSLTYIIECTILATLWWFHKSNLHMDMIIPPKASAILWPEARLHSITTHLPGRLLADQVVARERLPGKSQVWKACTDMVCTSPRRGRASWTWLTGIQNWLRLKIWFKAGHFWNKRITRSNIRNIHSMLCFPTLRNMHGMLSCHLSGNKEMLDYD
jgi:hypothetical protein